MCVRADLMAAIMKATACSDVIRSGWGRFEGRAVHSPGKELSGGARSNRQSCQTSHIHNSSKTLRNYGVDATHVDRLLITYEHRSCFPRNYASSTTSTVPLIATSQDRSRRDHLKADVGVRPDSHLTRHLLQDIP